MHVPEDREPGLVTVDVLEQPWSVHLQPSRVGVVAQAGQAGRHVGAQHVHRAQRLERGLELDGRADERLPHRIGGARGHPGAGRPTPHETQLSPGHDHHFTVQAAHPVPGEVAPDSFDVDIAQSQQGVGGQHRQHLLVPVRHHLSQRADGVGQRVPQGAVVGAQRQEIAVGAQPREVPHAFRSEDLAENAAGGVVIVDVVEQVSEDHQLLRVFRDGGQPFDVAVDIGHEAEPHALDRIRRWAASRRPCRRTANIKQKRAPTTGQGPRA